MHTIQVSSLNKDGEFKELDYKAIGQRNNDSRARIGMSQERLAELAGLSMTHMS